MPRVTAKDRKDPDVAGEVLETVFAGASHASRRSFFDFLAKDVEILASEHNDRWGIPLFDWGLRLNVGWVQCLVLDSGALRVLVHAEDVRPSIKLDGDSYAKAPGCDLTTVRLENVPKVLPSLEKAHRAALSSAAGWASPPNIRGAHSVGVTKLLSLRDPDYVSSRPHSPAAALPVYEEGRPVAALFTRFERDPRARKDCIAHYGLRCSVCEMSFGECYGETMRDLIHVHHVVPVSEAGSGHQTDPVRDLRPVCPNCHSVIHRSAPPLTIDEARVLLSAARGA